MSVYVWAFFVLHSVSCHNYDVACKTSLALCGHRTFKYQTVLGAGQVRLRRNQDVLACGSELIPGESLGIDVQNTLAGGKDNMKHSNVILSKIIWRKLTRNFPAGEDLIEILGGASVTTVGSRCGKTRALTSKFLVLVSKGEVTVQVQRTLVAED
jgi:hypothetical protein